MKKKPIMIRPRYVIQSRLGIDIPFALWSDMKGYAFHKQHEAIDKAHDLGDGYRVMDVETGRVIWPKGAYDA